MTKQKYCRKSDKIKRYYKHMYINNRIKMITYQNINVRSDPIWVFCKINEENYH